MTTLFAFCLVATLFFSLIHAQTSSNSTTTAGTTGTPCAKNETCTGPNEFCRFLSNFDAPCMLGMCECLPCFGLDREGICEPLNLLQLGHACFREQNEVIVVENADCYLGVVTCSSGFTQSGVYCGNDGGYAYGSSCDSSYFCAGDMKCLNGTCSCIAGGSYKFDEKLNACVLKELGDPCDTNEDCQITATMWNGFTADRAACINGTCSCSSDSQKATVAFVDTSTGDMKMKQLCVHTNGSLGLGFGSDCDADPALRGDSPEVEVCDSNFVCIQCPEDAAWGRKGKCRQVLSPAPPTVCYEPVKTPPITAVAAEPAVTDVATDAFEKVSGEDLKPVLSWADRVMMAVVNQSWYNNGWPYRQCSSAGQCFANENCLMPNFCHRGVCACMPPNYQDNHQNCLIPPASLDQVVTTPFPLLNSSSTIANQLQQPAFINLTSNFNFPDDIKLEDYYFGMKCTSVTDCGRIGLGCSSATVLNGVVQNGLHCLTNSSTDTSNQYCLCPPAQYKWDKKSFRCNLKEYGDSCTSDGDCDTGSYTKKTTGGFKCLADSNTCGCSVDFVPVTVSILQAAWGSVMPRNMPLTFSRKTYCVSARGHKSGVRSFGNCTIGLVENSDSATHTCASGLVCLYCPADTAFGMCTSIASILDTSNNHHLDSSSEADSNDRGGAASSFVKMNFSLILVILSVQTFQRLAIH